MNFLKRIPPFEVLLVTVILSIHLYAALSDAYNFPNIWFKRDDAYYYFKVAQNITEGLGSTFDGINMTNGYHPLWMLVCIPVFAFARFDLILPLRILMMVIGVLNAITAVMIYRLVKGNLSQAVAILASSFWAFNTIIYETVYMLGLETSLAAFAVILFIYKLWQFEKRWRTSTVTARQIALLAVSATIVMFSRLDLVFLAVIGGIWVVFRGKPMRVLLPLDILIIFVSTTTSVALRTGIAQYNSTYAASAVEAMLLTLVIKTLSLYLFGAYQHPRLDSPLKTIRQTGLAVTISSILSVIVYMLLVQLGFGKSFPRSAFLIDWVLSFVLLLALRLAMYWFGDASIKPRKEVFTPLIEFQTNWKKWLADGIAYYGVVGGALAVYMLYNKIAFGTSSPVSGQIKRWWGTLISTAYESPAPDWTSFFGIGYGWAYDAWQPMSSLFLWMGKLIFPFYPGPTTLDERYYISMATVILLAFVIFLMNARRVRRLASNTALIPLAAGCGVQILSYTVTAYGGAKEWYWVSEMVLVTLAGSLLLHLILLPLQKINLTRFALGIVSIALSASIAYQFVIGVKSAMRYNYFPADRPYMEVLSYLEENTPPGSIIGMTGGGNVGYFIHDRTIVNMDGLINSYDYFRALQNREAPIHLRQRGMTIVFANPRLLTLPPYYGQFAPYFENYSEYGGKNLIYLLEEPKY
jgi:hypothetical protein